MLTTVRAAIVALTVLLPTVVSGQGSSVTASPTNPDRWEAAVHVGWLVRGVTGGAPRRTVWYSTGSFDGSIGYFLTPHLKLAFGGGTSGADDVFLVETVRLPGSPYPAYRGREHRIRASTTAISMTYHFFENQWFHPFAGAGAMVVHESNRAGASDGFAYYAPGIVLPPLPPTSRTTTHVRPYLTGGFKAYGSERVFFQTDVRVVTASDRAESAALRAGVGVDF